MKLMKSLIKFLDMPYLFSQFSSLETGVLFSPLVALADEWTFMIWLAIICKPKYVDHRLKNYWKPLNMWNIFMHGLQN